MHYKVKDCRYLISGIKASTGQAVSVMIAMVIVLHKSPSNKLEQVLRVKEIKLV